MSDASPESEKLVDVEKLSARLDLPVEWLENEAKHARIPRLLVIGPYRRKIYRFNPRAVRDCLVLRAALGEKQPAKAGEESS